MFLFAGHCYEHGRGSLNNTNSGGVCPHRTDILTQETDYTQTRMDQVKTGIMVN